jgi:hypothetical protein
MPAPSPAVRRLGPAAVLRPVLVVVLAALTALVPLLGSASASARSASRAAAPTFSSAWTVPSSSAGSESRRTTGPAARTSTAGLTRRLHADQGGVDHSGSSRRTADTHPTHPAHPATGGADPTGPPRTARRYSCDRPDHPAHHRFLPVGAGRAPPSTCGS